MFKFLKIRTSAPGDAPRHVPFASIIHEHVLPLFLSLIFVLFSSVNSVYAIDVPLPPVWLPMNPYNSDALHNNYVILNEDQKKIANEIMGVYGSVFLGLAANPLQNPIDTVLKARSWLQEYGSTFFNTIFNSSVQSPRAMQDLVGSITYKASQYNSYNDYVIDTDPGASSGLEKYIQFTPELTVAYKNWFAVYGDVYHWQIQTKPFKSNVEYVSGNISETSPYWTAYNNLVEPKVRFNVNANSGSYGCVAGGTYFQTYKNLFLNTSTGKVYIVDNSGNTNNYAQYHLIKMQPSFYEQNYNVATRQINYPVYDTFVESVRTIYNNSASNYSATYLFNTYYGVFLEDFIEHVYVGADWSHKEEIYNIDDLNIAASPSAYIDNVGDDAFVNINGLIGYLGSNVTDVREGVFENTLVRVGDHAVELTDSILKAIDRAVEETKSGIVVPTDVFSSLFDDGKGFISYMWYMTKPLVIYTRDLLDLLTFDPVNGFNASGPGYFILGVVGLGVVGGVIVKFLL